MTTITTQFPELLAVAERDGQGGLKIEPVAITRGEQLTVRCHLPAHPVYDDWTEGAFKAVLKASPSADAPDLAEYTCTTGTPVGLLTPVTMILPVSEHGDLPVKSPATALAEAFLFLAFTPTGGADDTIAITRQLVKG
jgi:hypothetical protein